MVYFNLHLMYVIQKHGTDLVICPWPQIVAVAFLTWTAMMSGPLQKVEA